MKKIVKRFGSGVGIYFSKEETKIYNLKIGEIIDISIVERLTSDEDETSPD